MPQANKRNSYRVIAAIISAILILLFLTVMAAATEPAETAATEPHTTTAPENQETETPTEAPETDAPTEPATEAPTEPEPGTEAPTETEPQTETPTEPVEDPEPRNMFRLTPDGNLTLIDDFEYLVDVDGTILSKQFITVQSRDGSYFYIIIDRSGETENVYFLNQVDLADLKSLISGETQSIEEIACTCTTPCVPGNVDMSCPVCASNMAECAATESPNKDNRKEDEKKEDPPATEATEPTEKAGSDNPPAQKKTMNPYLALGLIVVVVAGVLFFVFKDKLKGGNRRSRKAVSEYDFDEDEDDEELAAEPEEEEAAPPTERLKPSAPPSPRRSIFEAREPEPVETKTESEDDEDAFDDFEDDEDLM